MTNAEFVATYSEAVVLGLQNGLISTTLTDEGDVATFNLTDRDGAVGGDVFDALEEDFSIDGVAIDEDGNLEVSWAIRPIEEEV